MGELPQFFKQIKFVWQFAKFLNKLKKNLNFRVFKNMLPFRTPGFQQFGVPQPNLFGQQVLLPSIPQMPSNFLII